MSEKHSKIIIFALIVLLIIALINIGIHVYQSSKLTKATEQSNVLKVATVNAVAGAMEQKIVLPANVYGWHNTVIYARVNGYVKRWLVDIGDAVKKGDLLAEIETPELDAALRQAEANLNTALANAQIAEITANRWKELVKTESVSQQETDQFVSNAIAAKAAVNAAVANRDQLRAQVDFKRVIAPFDGIVTSRTIDIGTLIDLGSDTKVSLFEMVQADRLRAYVMIPQDYGSIITDGIPAQFSFSQYPTRFFSGKLVNTAKAIDPLSRTLLAEFQIDNKQGELLAGSYARAHLTVVGQKSVRIPINTLLFRAQGLQVGTIDGDHRVILKSVAIGRDFGNEVEIIAGIKPNDRIIVNPPDSLMSGQVVEIVGSKK